MSDSEPPVKKSTKKPSSVANANIARETRLKRIQERKDVELNKQLDKRIKERLNVKPEESDSDSSDEEVIVYEPVAKPRKSRAKSKPIDTPVKSQYTLDLEQQIQDMNSRFKKLEDSSKPPPRSMEDDMIKACKHRILNF